MDRQRLLNVKNNAAELAVTKFEEAHLKGRLLSDQLYFIDAAFKLHGLACSELDKLDAKPAGCVEKEDLLNAIALIEKYMGPHQHGFKTLVEIVSRLKTYVGAGEEHS